MKLKSISQTVFTFVCATPPPLPCLINASVSTVQGSKANILEIHVVQNPCRNDCRYSIGPTYKFVILTVKCGTAQMGQGGVYLTTLMGTDHVLYVEDVFDKKIPRLLLCICHVYVQIKILL